MERSMMHYLMLSSLVLLSITSCSPAKLGKYEKVKDDNLAMAKRRVSTATYNTQIDLWGKHFSGLMVYKATSDSSERAIFITETGFKFFDFEFTPNGFHIKFCIKGLNKKFIINILRRDLGYFSDFRHLQNALARKTGNGIIYLLKTGNNRFDYYTTNTDGTEIKKIEHGNDRHKSLVVNFDGLKSGNFDTIRIDDHSAHLKIFMKQIDQ